MNTIKKTVKIFFVFYAILGFINSNYAQNQEKYNLWRNLIHGAYNVGYKVLIELMNRVRFMQENMRRRIPHAVTLHSPNFISSFFFG